MPWSPKLLQAEQKDMTNSLFHTCTFQDYVQWSEDQIATKQALFEASADALLDQEVTDLVQIYFLLRHDPDSQVCGYMWEYPRCVYVRLTLNCQRS